MQIIIFTGPPDGNALATAATAAAAAAEGARVLLASVGPSHPLIHLVGAPAASEPQTLAPGLDLWCLDPLAELSALWGSLRVANGPIGDELPVIPGGDLFLAATRLRKLDQAYDLACIDVGSPETFLRSLAAPDTFRWITRLFVGLDRGPGRSSASVARALIPATFQPMIGDWASRSQDARVQFEVLREHMANPSRTQVRYVMRPDKGGLAEARIAVPSLHLYGLAVECLMAGPVLPSSLKGSALAPLVAEQEAVINEAGAVFHGRAIYGVEAMASPGSIAPFATYGAQLYGEDSPLPGPPIATPIVLSGPPTPSVALNLPGLHREILGLTLSGDELIVKIGPYRRHLLLPEGLRGTTAIKASRQGETLIISPRT